MTEISSMTETNMRIKFIQNSKLRTSNYPNIIPTMVADNSEARVPPNRARIP